jgi:hypothetical protein
MVEVGDVYESEIAIYKIVRESKCKWFIERTNKATAPFSPAYTFPVCGYWKKSFFADKLKKISPTKREE